MIFKPVLAALVFIFAVQASVSKAEVTLVFAGDVMLGRMVDETVRVRGPRHIWGDVLSLLRNADAVFANLECVISEPRDRFPNRAFYFRAAPETGQALSSAGIDYVSLANNHAMDFRAGGLLQTIGHLDKMQIAHAGAGRDRENASQPVMLDIAGIKIGVVAFADHFREYAADEDSAGINWIDLGNLDAVRTAISAARAAGADLVVFSIHWGPNMRERPTPEFIEFAHAVIDAGADIFHGHSAHIFQAIEIYKGKPILYDTGDLIDDYYVDPQLRNDQQLLFVVLASRGRVEQLELVPLVIRDIQVNLARGAEFEEIHARMRRLSSSFGTEIERARDRLIIRLRD